MVLLLVGEVITMDYQIDLVLLDPCGVKHPWRIGDYFVHILAGSNGRDTIFHHLHRSAFVSGRLIVRVHFNDDVIAQRADLS